MFQLDVRLHCKLWSREEFPFEEFATVSLLDFQSRLYLPGVNAARPNCAPASITPVVPDCTLGLRHGSRGGVRTERRIFRVLACRGLTCSALGPGRAERTLKQLPVAACVCSGSRRPGLIWTPQESVNMDWQSLRCEAHRERGPLVRSSGGWGWGALRVGEFRLGSGKVCWLGTGPLRLLTPLHWNVVR